jgi:nucleoside phosphorylase
MPCAVIATALPVEYLAVRAHLSDIQEEVSPQGTIYERGRFAANGQTWEIGIFEAGLGNMQAAVAVTQAITYFNPQVVLSVGIAAGIKNVSLGDVVAATKIYNYESGRAGERFQGDEIYTHVGENVPPLRLTRVDNSLH